MTFIARFGAVSGLTAALFLALPGAVEFFTGETLATSIIIGLSPALATPLLIALYLGQAGRGGVVSASGRKLPAVAFAVNLLGLGLFGGAAFALNIVVFPLGIEDDLAPASRIVLLASTLVFVVGVVLFGIALLRARVHPAWAAWLYLIGFPVFAVNAALPDSWVGSLLHIVVGAALAGLALGLRRVRDREQAPTWQAVPA